MVAVDGANPAPAAGSRFRRLLRRGLLIAVLTAAGWLLTAMFATSASADEPPPDTPPAQDERPVSAPPADPAEPPAEPPAAEPPADEPGEQPGQPPTDESGEQPGQPPAEEPGDQPGQPPEEPGDQPSEPPAEEPVGEPGGQPGEEPGAEPAEQPGEEPGAEPVDLAPEPAPPVTEPVPAPDQPAGPDTPPVQEQHGVPQQGGLVGGLTSALGGITHAVADVAAVVLHDAGQALVPIVEPSVDDSVLPLPGLLPDLGRLPGLDGPLDPDGAARAEVVPATPPAPPATPALPRTVVIAPEHPPRVAVAVGTPRSTSSQPGAVTEHADESDPGQPVKTPAAPVAPGGTFVSTGYDGAGGTRGPHGVLADQALPRPSTAGFTTRSRAADTTGRVAGLPAISPD